MESVLGDDVISELTVLLPAAVSWLVNQDL